jgi:hypothetical protein
MNTPMVVADAGTATMRPMVATVARSVFFFMGSLSAARGAVHE